MTAHPLSSTSRDKAIIFDLDDTLVDTFNHLITPLEHRAASEMIAAGIGVSDHPRLVEFILNLRKTDPENLEERLVQKFPQAAGKALEARRAVFDNASPDKLTIDSEVKRMLEELKKTERYDMYLLTTGAREFQNKKVKQLDVGHLFSEVEVLNSGSEITKEIWLDNLARKHHYNKASVVVVGNRLDNEIQAGNKLGMTTVWVKHGEGSELSPNEKTGKPDRIIFNITEFPGVLNELESSRAHK